VIRTEPAASAAARPAAAAARAGMTERYVILRLNQVCHNKILPQPLLFAVHSQIAAALEKCRHGREDAPAAGRRRVRGRPDSQAFAKFSEAAHLRRGGRGQVDRVGLFQAAGRPGTLDIATAGRGGRRN